ncbi:hypothetical protein [Butyrivibrio sp. MC2013]|uniref:hypothetical protein n=1 Tax=Butyrivibrio sp. MC2013 TaxID=1280686 RepID=UPI00047A054B|nr:hypothetical protein [Butyrivibrio sp. MC2013]
MFDRLMGNFLISRDKITDNQLERVYELQGRSRARLGVIAVTEHLMTIPQAEEINSLQAAHDKRFGDLAVEKGYLTESQVERLLERQGNEYMSFCQAIVDSGIMTLDDIYAETHAYQIQNGLMESEMEALRNNDLDRIVPIFAKDADDDIRRLFTIAIKTIYRLLDPHISIGYMTKKSSVTGECVGYQAMTGGSGLMTSVSGSYQDLQSAAMLYTKEEFLETREDVMDALCELINCINGLYATEVSTETLLVELEPPIYKTTFANIVSTDICSLPLQVGNANIFLNISKAEATELH